MGSRRWLQLESPPLSSPPFTLPPPPSPNPQRSGFIFDPAWLVVILLVTGFCTLFYLTFRQMLDKRRHEDLMIQMRLQLRYGGDGEFRGGGRPQIVLGPVAAAAARSADPQGLDPKVLACLPVLEFVQQEEQQQPHNSASEQLSSGERDRGAAAEAAGSGAAAANSSKDCSICLSEFADHEKLRFLPHCSHIFHLDCIDMWLQSHGSCPICRDSVGGLTIASSSDGSSDGSSSSDDSSDGGFDLSSRQQQLQLASMNLRSAAAAATGDLETAGNMMILARDENGHSVAAASAIGNIPSRGLRASGRY